MTIQNQTVTDDVVRKIQLLFALAERAAGNEAEAAAAMAKAQELLAKHNLDLATVQDAAVAGGVNATKAEARHEKADAKRNATYKWTQDLYRAVAEANYCKYWAAETRVENEKTGRVRWVKRHRVLGRVDNTTVVLMMGDYLYATIMRLLPYDKTSRLSADAIAWCEGCVARLSERIAAKAEAMRTPDYAAQGEAGYCTAIAVRDMAAAEEIGNYEAEHGPRLLGPEAETGGRLRQTLGRMGEAAGGGARQGRRGPRGHDRGRDPGAAPQAPGQGGQGGGPQGARQRAVLGRSGPQGRAGGAQDVQRGVPRGPGGG
jgi:hypothetical protein